MQSCAKTPPFYRSGILALTLPATRSPSTTFFLVRYALPGWKPTSHCERRDSAGSVNGASYPGIGRNLAFSAFVSHLLLNHLYIAILCPASLSHKDCSVLINNLITFYATLYGHPPYFESHYIAVNFPCSSTTNFHLICDECAVSSNLQLARFA